MKELFSNIRGDAFGGITAGIVALPLALAFGVSSGLGPSAGLYGAIFISFFAALFGGTNTQISGPTAPMTAVSMVVIASIVAANEGDVQKALPSILLVFLLAGLIQVLLGVLRLGEYIRYIPYPVVSGFMTAIGLIIIITQILPAIGYYPKEDHEFVERFKPQAEEIILENILREEAGEGILVIDNFEETIKRADEITPEAILKESKSLAAKNASGTIGALKVFPRAFKNINWLELILSLSTIIIVFGFKKITTKLPSSLVALIVISTIAVVFDLDYRTIEEIPSGIPMPHLDVFTNLDLGSISPYIFTALTLSILGAIDSLLTSVVADNMTKTKHKPNRELVGQGIGNSIAAIFGGIPGAGATIRTVVNIKAGGRTKLSGMIAGLVLLIIMLALAPVASKIPAAVLAGILVMVGVDVMDYKGLKAIPSLPKDLELGPIKLSTEVIIMLIVLGLSTFWDLIYAVGIGLVIASLMFMKKIGNMTGQRSSVKSIKETMWVDELNFPEKFKEEVFIKHINGPLFFGSTSDFSALTVQIPDTAMIVIMRLGRMQYMDQSGLYAMEDMLLNLKERNIEVLFVNLLKQPRYMMERIDIIPDFIGEDRIFKTFEECIAWINKNVKDQF
ncbi:SulP family inorganic anion transporter [Winogradskyella aurantia]|uniref:Sodium-independent anion transporter n=1 Tax=Winogradskyella aurantia TaxID=1915063 RepID=A0A265V0B5_9FLAO|nr:SulP family inorganic anion transporter [Winogradskyella aurantia]OZV71001.1 sodium-independent anion transporter [Winogradskyella aurantia]